ncbi:MAG: esterase family protein [Tannerella sp.]|jgi:S-formylglutathione hydrolase FrmB|nr:esterase family protein [Tannerella sp.]
MKAKSRLAGIFLFALLAAHVFAGRVDTVSVYSPSMNVWVKNTVTVPDDADSREACPVVYLLHGYGGDYRSWLQIHPGLPELATRYGVIIVCPDGKNSWYWDSPAVPAQKYETYITRELIPFMDAHYKTVPRSNGRAVTGLSMGGHGGLWLGFRHPELFGACGSTSGGVDIRPFPENWEMKKWLGSYCENRERWDAHTVVNQLHRLRPDSQAIIIDCGTEDFFYEVNEALHRKLLDRHIPHDYLTRPGQHNAAYWKNSIEYQLLFFHLFFDRTSSR